MIISRVDRSAKNMEVVELLLIIKLCVCAVRASDNSFDRSTVPEILTVHTRG